MNELHVNTPNVSCFDGRGLPVRQLAYYRDSTETSSTTRVIRQWFSASRNTIREWDPRLFGLSRVEAVVQASQESVCALSGRPLLSTQIDAGWHAVFDNAAGLTLHKWDGRFSHLRCEYDEVMRPISSFEQIAGEVTERCIERFTYGESLSKEAERNKVGLVTRHDDPAGSLWYDAYGILGHALSEKRQFCNTLLSVDWPALVKERDRWLETDSNKVEVTYTSFWEHDAIGDVKQQIDALDNLKKITVDIAGRAAAVEFNDTILLKSVSYDASGQAETEVYGNDVITVAKFSSLDGRLHGLKAYTLEGKTLQDLQYRYDPAGNVERIGDLSQPVQWYAQQCIRAESTYTYDTLYQLKSATGRENAIQTIRPQLPELVTFGANDDSRWRNYKQHYSYDSAGNLTLLKHDAGVGNTYTREMVVDKYSNRSLLKGSSPIDFDKSFDKNGNQLSLMPGQAMRWNALNQLRQVTLVRREAQKGESDDVEVYTYDGSGQRVRKVRRAIAAGSEQLAEVRYLPGLQVHKLTSGERRIEGAAQAGRMGVRLLHWESGRPAGIENDQLRYGLTDHLGSTTLELDQRAQLISQERFYPYGGTSWWAARTAIDAKYKTVRYSGKERDATGLYYYGLRYYAPWLQRWINPDPAGSMDGLNLYRFVRNSPVQNADSVGLAPIDILNPTAEQRKLTRLDKREVDPVLTLYKSGILEKKPSVRSVPVTEDIWDRLQLADAANRFTKALLPYGAGNQVVDVWRTQGESHKKIAPLRKSFKELEAENGDYARAAVAVGAGNCGEHAHVAFSLLASTKRNHPISFVKAKGHDHGFVVIGDINAEGPENLVYVDSWVTFPLAHLGKHAEYSIEAVRATIPAGNADLAYAIDEKALLERSTLKFPANKVTNIDNFHKVFPSLGKYYDEWFSLSAESYGVKYSYGGKDRLGYYSKHKTEDKVKHFERYKKVSTEYWS